MIDIEKLKELLDLAVLAPSGDNSQPWYFEVDKDRTVFLYNEPKKDNPYLNYNQSGSLMGHGAVIENIFLAANSFGLDVQMQKFPKDDNPDCVARFTFSSVGPHATESKSGRENFEEKLFNQIKNRHTNRRPYKKNVSISEVFRGDIKSIVSRGLNVDVSVVDQPKDVTALARAGSKAEIVILETQELHKLLFKGIVWSEKEEKQKREGLLAQALELNPVQFRLFKACRGWKVMSFFNKISFSHFIAKEDSKVYASASAYLVFSFSKGCADFVDVGRAVQRAWLLASSYDYAVHPIAATLFFGQRFIKNDIGELSTKHQKIIGGAYQSIVETVGATEDDTLAFMMRIGVAKKPSCRSSKKEARVKYL